MKNKLKVSEASISQSVKEALQIAENQGKLLFLRNNTGATPISHVNKKGEQYNSYMLIGKKGFGDFIGGFRQYNSFDADLGADMIYFEVECKSSTGKQSPEQVEHQKNIESKGGTYWLVNPENLQDFLDWIADL